MYRVKGLGDFPPINGQCWSPPGSIKPGWNKADALATCTYQAPAGTALPGGGTMTAFSSGAWYTTWWGIGLIAVVGFMGYKFLIAK